MLKQKEIEDERISVVSLKVEAMCMLCCFVRPLKKIPVREKEFREQILVSRLGSELAQTLYFGIREAILEPFELLPLSNSEKAKRANSR